MPVALLTDFGNKEHYVGAVKGVILTISPDASIVDISHEITPHDIREASYVLASCFDHFPPETVFLCVVDPGVGSARKGIAVRTRGSYYVGPDNGLISLIIDGSEFEAVELSNGSYFLDEISATFHGRDIFAPVAAHLINGVKIDDLGPRLSELQTFTIPRPSAVANGGVEGSVIHIDRFGNIITDLSAGLLGTDNRIIINGHQITRIARTYAEVGHGEPFIIVGSSGYLEISVNGASAADALGARTGQTIILETNIE